MWLYFWSLSFSRASALPRQPQEESHPKRLTLASLTVEPLDWIRTVDISKW